jgi:hypothetical protein
MNLMPTIISFFTQDWEYPNHAKRLIKECKMLNLDFLIKERESAGGYLQNTCMKPFFILECLKELKRPVLWVDIDASIYHRPIIFENLSKDMAARPKAPQIARKWHVGTLWFNYTPKAINFLEKWCQLSNELSDEYALQKLWETNPDIDYLELPSEYHFILLKNMNPNHKTVIAHRISSGGSKKEQEYIWKK